MIPTILETTAMNPQFHIQIPRSAGGGGSQSGNQSAGGGSGSSKCHVVVSVTQVGAILVSACFTISRVLTWPTIM